jgi:hypothetical protein
MSDLKKLREEREKIIIELLKKKKEQPKKDTAKPADKKPSK